MSTARKAPATKKAASRTTPRGAKVVNFDTERKKIVGARKEEKPKKWAAYGIEWTVKTPNIMLTSLVVGGEVAQDDNEDLASATGRFTSYILAHVVQDERQKFMHTLIKDEDLDIDVLVGMVKSLATVVYGD
jgi:hypothetical protein